MKATAIYAKDVSRRPILTRQQEADVFRRLELGDEKAREELVEANLRFAVMMANEYRGSGLDLDDLIQWANMGLVEAARKFIPSKGWRFSTYAIWYIRQRLIDAIHSEGPSVRPPIYRQRSLNRIRRAQAQLEHSLGRECTLDELADAAGMSQQEIEEALYTSTVRVMSLDQNMEDRDRSGGGGAVSDTIPDPNAQTADAVIDGFEHKQVIREIEQRVTPREMRILKLYHGFSGGDDMTLDSIGAAIGISKERVRQIRDVAYGKCRHPKVMRKIAAALAAA